LLSALFGALPYLFGSPHLGFAEAFFESMSGFTTTGSTVITDLTLYPSSILLWRSLTQWLGGMGILVLFVAVLSYLGVGSKSLFRHESSGYSAGGFQSRIRETALTLWQIYVFLSILCIIGLRMLGMSTYDAITHGFTTLSTGGFSVRNESIAYYDNAWIDLWLTLFMALGGVSFMLYAWLLRGRLNRWKMEEETKAYLAIIFLAFAAIVANLIFSGTITSIGQASREVIFQVLSVMTTTGFATADYNQWPAFSKGTMILLMFIGGCAGSTAGGIKVSRVILLFKISRQELIGAFRPSQVLPLKLNGRIANESLKPQTLFFICLTGLIVAIGTVFITLFEPNLSILSSFSGAAATLFNIGPGLDALGPTCNFAGLNAPTLLLMSLLMVLGRLELFAILVLFMPSLWKKY